MAEIIQTAELENLRLSPDENHWVYNGLDCCVTGEIFNTLYPLVDDVSRKTYEFSKALQAPILEMSLRGLLINQSRKHKVIQDMRRKLVQLEANLQTLVRDGLGVDGLNWRSPAQLGNLFYKVMNMPVQKKRKSNGTFGPSTDRECLEKLGAYFIAEPIVNHILALRDLGKSLGFLQTHTDSDGRMRTNFNIGGTDTGRFSSEATDFGTGCVRPTAEALTRNGWKALSEIQDGEEIAQWDNGVISFVPAKMHWQEFDGELLEVKTEQIQLAMTPCHRVLSSDYRGNTSTQPAGVAAKKKQQRIPLAGIKRTGEKTIPAYAAMLMADCSKEGTVWRASWKKPRKIERMLQLMREANVRVEEGTTNREGYRRFTIYADINLPKKYGPWVLDLSPKAALDLINEAKYWDAHSRNNSFIFYSADREEAKWFQTLCNLNGKGTTFRAAINSASAYGKESWIYSVNVKPRQQAQVLQKHWGTKPYKGLVGCPTVPSSYWLVRENGFISVTGNTNLQNVTSSLRSIFVADPGMKFANLDLEQADSRNVGALCWNLLVDHPDWDEASAGRYLDFCEAGDLHTEVVKMANPQLPFGDGRTDREVADMIAYRHLSYRDLAKKLGHGSNFYGQPPTMAKHAKITVAMADEFQRNYFNAFPCIPAWHENVKWQLENMAQLTTPFGRRRFFFGRLNDVATLRKAIAHQPQSMTADEINNGILRLWRANRVQLLVTVHDSILFQYPEEMEDEILPWAIETMKVYLELKRGRQFFVPVEAQVGWNWGYADDEDNPDGLIKWKGHDDRKRQEKQFKLSLAGM